MKSIWFYLGIIVFIISFSLANDNDKNAEPLLELPELELVEEEQEEQEETPVSQVLPKNIQIQKPEIDEYTPTWNVEGSWTMAENRQELLRHLMGPNHKHSLACLEKLSTDDLQRLHDSDHNKRKTSSTTYVKKYRLFKK